MSSKQYVVILLMASWGLVGCVTQHTGYNENSGPDGIRDTAPQLYLNSSQDDRCNAEMGDNEDWRYMLLEEPGVLDIAVRVDNPQLNADIYIHDGFGRPVDRLKVNPSSDFYAFPPLEVPKGRYFFRMACMKGASVYTVSARFITPQVLIPKPQIKIGLGGDENKSHDESDEGQGGSSTGRGKGSVEKSTEVTEGHQEEPERAAIREIEGTITLVTPGEDGKTKIVIRGVGKSNGVSKEMTGRLKGRDKKVKLYTCYSTKCQGFVDADEEELREFTKVVFAVPES